MNTFSKIQESSHNAIFQKNDLRWNWPFEFALISFPKNNKFS